MYQTLALLSVLIFIPLTPFAHKLPQSLNALVAAVFVVLLVARVINASMCVAKIAEGSQSITNTYQASQLEWNLPYAKIEWFLQLFYDT